MHVQRCSYTAAWVDWGSRIAGKRNVSRRDTEGQLAESECIESCFDACLKL